MMGVNYFVAVAFQQKLSQPVPVPTPEPANPPRPVSVASVGTMPTPKQAPIPPNI